MCYKNREQWKIWTKYIYKPSRAFLPKEIKVDEVTDTVPPQDWAWQRFIIGGEGLMSPHPFPCWRHYWQLIVVEGSSGIFISSVDIEK